MGYFSNGTEGTDFELRYCGKCVHEEDCPVWSLHLQWNYEQFPEQKKKPTNDTEVIIEIAKDEVKREVLDTLIVNKMGQNKCVMFHKETKPEFEINTVEDEQKFEIFKQKFNSLTLEQLEKL